jgi:nucleotide-binding universal stress UspA family protein
MQTHAASPALLAAPHARARVTSLPALDGPVLLASDGGAPTDATALAARAIAGHLGVRVDALGVLEPLPVCTIPYDTPLIPPDFEVQRRRRLEHAVVARLEPVLGSRADWRLDVRYGPIDRVIATVARERGTSLIVLGSGGHRAVTRLLGEEIPVQVIRHAACPVLAVAPDLRQPLRRAVVGIDFSAASIRAALTALALLDPGADGAALLTLVHVRSPFEHDYPILGSWAGAYDADIAARLTRLRAFLRPHVPPGVTLETRTRIGSVPGTLSEIADAMAAQLVAVGTHGPGWVERLLLGSVATTVIRQAGRTVLVTPAPSAAECVRLELAVAGDVALERPEEWAVALDAFTTRNLGRAARLEVSDPALGGLTVLATSDAFTGAAYDRHDGAVALMLGDGTGDAGRLTHTIRHVRRVEIGAADEARRGEILIVGNDLGETVLTLRA